MIAALNVSSLRTVSSGWDLPAELGAKFHATKEDYTCESVHQHQEKHAKNNEKRFEERNDNR